jgi:hemerythrin-like domain-containing protein
MKRAPALVRLSWDHHHGLVMALRIGRELPGATDEGVDALYGDLVRLWAAGLLPHFRAEGECLLARLVRHTGSEDERIQRTGRDHLALEALIVDMRDDPDRTRRRDSLARFGVLLREHIRWEEAVLFEAAQHLMSAHELDAAGRQMDEELPPLAPAPPPPAPNG